LNFLNRMQPFALLLMRLMLGAIMIVHGYREILGGFHSHRVVAASLGLPAWMAYLSASAELAGGVAMVLGVLTRFVALAMLVEMAVVIAKAHWKNLVGPGGYEFPLVLATLAFALLCYGGGPYALSSGKRTASVRKMPRSRRAA